MKKIVLTDLWVVVDWQWAAVVGPGAPSGPSAPGTARRGCARGAGTAPRCCPGWRSEGWPWCTRANVLVLSVTRTRDNPAEAAAERGGASHSGSGRDLNPAARTLRL